MPWKRLRKIIQRTLFFPSQADRDLDDEIRFHLAEEARLQSGRGLSEDDAALAAHRAFGNVALAKEETRAVWVSTRLEQCLQDLRFGCRILTRSPGVSLTATILIALVIGGNTTVFSIAHGVLAKPSPGVHAPRLATVSWVAENGDIETHQPYQVYRHFLEQSTAFQPVAAFDFARLTMTLDSGSYALRAGIVSPNYFDTLGVRLVKGRSFLADEAKPGPSGLVVVIAHHIWQNNFGGSDDIIGRPVTVNGQPATVVGVAEPNFRGAIFIELADLWIPLTGEARDQLQVSRGTAVAMIGQRKDGVSLWEAQAQLATLWTQLQQARPELKQRYRVTLVRYSGTAGGNSIVATRGNRMLAVFSAVTFLTIVIVCANVTNLLIARAVVRQREMAVRESLGASRGRIVRSLLAEGLVLSVVAWLAACVFAWWVSKAVVPFLVPETGGPVVTPDLTPDWTVVAYALGLALLCTLAVTAGPALRTRHQQLLPFLKVGEQGVVPGRSRLTHGLVVLQLAFSVLLLTSAGLARRSLSLHDSLDVGFDPRNVLLATVNTAGGATTPQTNGRLLEGLQDQLARLPGVEHVSYRSGRRLSSSVDFPVRREQSDAPVLAVNNAVAPGYLATFGVPLVAGRDFTRAERSSSRPAIVTRQLADTLWPHESAIGKILLTGPGDRPARAEIIGVVENAYFSGRGSEGPPRYVFFSTTDRPPAPGEATFFIRHHAGLEGMAPAVARALREADGRIPIGSLRLLETEIAAEVAPFWILATLLTLFAAGSLIIAAIGQYAVVAFDGRRRTREFGLRIALGASSSQLVTAVMTESFRLTAIGIVAGFALSVAAGTVLARVLFGITPTDPPTYLGVFVLLAAASLVACYLPARRAARTDPLVALRTE
jgi:putative ABC transport system permease protein